MRPALYLVGGASGAGKDTLLLGARDSLRGDAAFVFFDRDVTRADAQCTALEVPVTAAEFEAQHVGGAYALSWAAHGTRYGVRAAAIDAALAAGQTCVANVSRGAFDGAAVAYAARADVFIVVVSAPREALRARLEGRGRDAPAAVAARVERAAAYDTPRGNVLRVSNDGSVEAGVAKFVDALRSPWRFRVEVVGLVGCSASGKSTLAAALGGNVVACDSHYRPLSDCPRFDLGAVPWANGVPEAFAARGNADLNHPEAVDWPAVADAVDAAVDAAIDAARLGRAPETAAPPRVFVEGLLLLGDGGDAVRRRVARWVLLDDGFDDAAAQERLWRRKWTRTGHLGKPSYFDRGVTAEDYAAYWTSYVAPAWKAHGLDRWATLCGAWPTNLVLDCHRPVDENARALLEEPAVAGAALPPARRRRPRVVGIAGASGSGKTTLARALAALVSATCVPEEARFFKKSSAPAYALRDPVSEEPAHVDWPATTAHVRHAIAASPHDVVLVEHFLLLAPGGGADWLLPLCDAVLYVSVGADDAARALCRERRVGRSARAANEEGAVRAYYDDYVWPAFLRNTHEPCAALKAHGGVVEVDARRGPEAVLADAETALDALSDQTGPNA